VKAHHRKRLLRLADLLDTVPPEHFDLGVWLAGDGPPCKTAACAVGWATTIPAFRRAGLTTDSSGWPIYSEWGGFNAAEQFFGLTEDDALHLFASSYRYRLADLTRPTTVARRIREFVEAQP